MTGLSSGAGVTPARLCDLAWPHCYFSKLCNRKIASSVPLATYWFIDTDYNEESFFVRHAYFLGANDPYKSLKTTLKSEINEDAWASLNSDTSRPFNKPKTGRIAIKVINHLGDEVMKVFRVWRWEKVITWVLNRICLFWLHGRPDWLQESVARNLVPRPAYSFGCIINFRRNHDLMWFPGILIPERFLNRLSSPNDSIGYPRF